MRLNHYNREMKSSHTPQPKLHMSKRENPALTERQKKLSYLFILIVLLTTIFLISILNTIHSDREIPSYHSTLHDRSFRGDILSKENYKLSYSQKSYKAVIYGQSIKPEKRTLFIKLFSIYSGIKKSDIKKAFTYKSGKKRKGYITISRKLNATQAQQLKALAYKLRQLNVFKAIEIKPGVKVLYGLDIIESGEHRIYPLGDVMTPVLGYINKKYENDYTRPHGQKGLEGHYEKHIHSKKNGYFQGKRDVGGNIIHNKNSIKQLRVDGLNLHLNIPLNLQARIEKTIDHMKHKVNADEILVGVMESHTGKLLTLATTKRYTPTHISKSELSHLDPKFSEYTYESGSVLKPIVFSIALEHSLITPNTWIDTENGVMRLGRFIVRDDHKHKSLTATDVIVESSNIGMAKIAWRMHPTLFRKGLEKFGFGHPSGIDLNIDNHGKLLSYKALKNKINRASNAYGYGMTVTFTQLLKAYSAFNNYGHAVTPRLTAYLTDTDHNTYTQKRDIGSQQAINPQVTQTVYNTLKKVVERGTGKGANYPGLTIGGKTGTAKISQKGGYGEEYHSSFFGFANDKQGHKYTIGVLVIKPKEPYTYYAAKSAVPTFKNIVHILSEQGYLYPDATEEELQTLNIDLYGEETTHTTPTPTTQNKKVQTNQKKRIMKQKPKRNKEIQKLFKTL
jgi:cell division protein FtsI (penicillin-binding protein 3)